MKARPKYLIAFGLYLVICLASLRTDAQTPWPGNGVPLPADPSTLMSNGTINFNGTVYPFSIPWTTINDIAYQFSQGVGGSIQLQTQGQWAIPTCLVAPPGNPTNLTQTLLDWTQYKLRSPIDGAIFNVRPDTGAVYKNGQRLGANFVQKLCVFGNDLLGKGKTDGKWWRWTGITAANPPGWTLVTTDVDPNSLD